VAHLRILTGALEGKTFTIEPGLTLGREGHNSLPMPDNKKASRDHAKVWRSGPNQFEIADLGSRNGTFVNDEQITRAPLKDGDLVRVGDVEMRFEMEEAEKPKPKVKPPAERPSLADVLRGEAKPSGAAAAANPAMAIEIKQRILQYNKKSGKGSMLGTDVSQTAGTARWIMIGIALVVAAGLFFLVRGIITGMRGGEEDAPADAGGDR
jgi:pSer/pThr/pTyr-binding forkhead associated (FHA) protein